jgi:uncharacterized protein (TIGR03437 family)
MRALAVAMFWITSAFGQQIVGIANPALGTTVFPDGYSPQLARGSLVRIIWSAPDIGRPYPPDVSIGFQPTGSDRFFRAQVLSSTPDGEIVAIIPRDMPLGASNIVLVLNATEFPPAQVEIANASIGIFTVSGSGAGPALAQNVSGSQVVLNQLTSPALPGEYVTLWATGLGAYATTDANVVVGGERIQPSFAGPAPTLPGVDQINFQMPADAPYGCYVPVTVSAGASTSNAVTIATAAAAGACSHPLALSPDELGTLDRGDSILLGTISFGAAFEPPSGLTAAAYTRLESVTVQFITRYAYDIFLLSSAQPMNTISPSCGLGSFGFGASRVTSPQEPVAGPSLKAEGPSNQVLDVPISDFALAFSGVPPTGGIYSRTLDPPTAVATASQLPPPFFTPGPWRMSAPGGETIAAFQQAYSLPPQVRWRNREALATFSRSSDVSISWDAQGYSANDVMRVGLVTGFKTLACIVPAQSGQLALPRNFLQQMDPTTLSEPFFLSSLSLSLAPRSPGLFRLPLIDGGSAPALISYQFSDSVSVVVQ